MFVDQQSRTWYRMALGLVAVLTVLGLTTTAAPASALPRLSLTLEVSAPTVSAGETIELSGRSPVWLPGSTLRAQLRTERGWQTVATVPLGRDRSYAVAVEPPLGDNSYRTQLLVRDVLIASSPTRTVQGLLAADPPVVPAGAPVTISGRLPTAVERPVVLQRRLGEVQPQALQSVTDADGRVSFTFIPQGQETVRIFAPAFPAERLAAFASPFLVLTVVGTPPDPDPEPDADAAMPVAVVGEPYDAIAAFEPRLYAPLRVVGGDLPPGLRFSDWIGPTLTGIPTTAGTFRFTIEQAAGVQRTVSIRVLADPPPPDGPVTRTAVSSPVVLSDDGGTGVYTAFLDRGTTTSQRKYQIFAWDRSSGRSRQISRTTAGEGSYGAVISADGRVAAFYSGNYPDRAIEIADLTTGSVSRVPDAPNTCSECPLALSGDGRHLAFTKDIDGQQAVVLRDLFTGSEDLVSHANGDYDRPLPGRVVDVSDDGQKVTFTSSSDEISDRDRHPGTDVFQWNTAVGFAFPDTNIGEGTFARPPVASADARFIAYTLTTGMLVGTSYLWDTWTGETKVVPDPQPNVPGRILTVTNALSADGRYAVREQMGDTSGTNVYRYDFVSEQAVKTTPAELAGQPIGGSIGRSISGDGRVVSILAIGSGNVFGAVWATDD